MLEFGVFDQALVDELLTVDSGLSFQDYLQDLTITDLDLIIRKICEYTLESISSDLERKECVILRILEVLWDIIARVEISEAHCLSLSKSLLFLIVEFGCNVVTAKKVIYLINRLFEHQPVVESVLEDESMKFALKHLGDKVLEIGDYECQVMIVEVMLRISDSKSRKTWATVWFHVESIQAIFLSIKPEHFELECRRFLNFLNKSEFGQKVHSFVAHTVIFDGCQLKEPYGSDFWIDFNYASQSISFYCSELKENDDGNSTQGLWETVVISSDVVHSCILNVDIVKHRKELTIYLNCPSYELLSQPKNSSLNMFKGNRIKLSFWEFLDLHPHIQFVYGSLYKGENDLQNHEDDIYYQNMHCSQKRRKTSNATLYSSKNNIEEKCNEICSQDNLACHNRNRKISAATVCSYNEIESNFSQNCVSQNGNRKISEAAVYSFENYNENPIEGDESMLTLAALTSQPISRKASKALVCNEKHYDNDINNVSNRLDQELHTSQHRNRKISEACAISYEENCNANDMRYANGISSLRTCTSQQRSRKISGACAIPYEENCNVNDMSNINDISSLRTCTSQQRSRKSSKALVQNVENQKENYSSCDTVIGSSQTKKRKAIDFEKDDELDIDNGVKDYYQSSNQFKIKSLNSDKRKTSNNVVNCKESGIGNEKNIHAPNFDLAGISNECKKTSMILGDFNNEENASNYEKKCNFIEMVSSQNKNGKIPEAVAHNIREVCKSSTSKNKNPLAKQIAEFQTESELIKNSQINRKSTIDKINEKRSRTVRKISRTLRGNLFELVEALDDKKDNSIKPHLKNENKSERKAGESINILESQQKHLEEVTPLRRKNPARNVKSNTQTKVKSNKKERTCNKVNFDNKKSTVGVTADISLSQIEKETDKEIVIKNGNLEQKSADEISPSQIESKSVRKRMKNICLDIDEISPTQTEKSVYVRVSESYNPIKDVGIIKDKTSNLSDDQRIMTNSVIPRENQVIIDNKNISIKTISQAVNHNEQNVKEIPNCENNSDNRSNNPARKLKQSSQDNLDSSTKRTVTSESNLKILDENSKHDLEFCVEDKVRKKSTLVTVASLSSDIDQSDVDSSSHRWHDTEMEELNENPNKEFNFQGAENKSSTNSAPDLDDLVNQIILKRGDAKVSKNSESDSLVNQTSTRENTAKQDIRNESSNFLKSKKKMLTSKLLNEATNQPRTYNKLLIESDQLERDSGSADSGTKKKEANELQKYDKLLSKSNQLETDSGLEKKTSYGRAYIHRLVLKSNKSEDSAPTNFGTGEQTINVRPQTLDEVLTKPNQVEKLSGSTDSLKRNKTQKSRKIRLYNADRAPLYTIDLEIPKEKKQFQKDELFSVVIPPGDELGEEWEQIQHSPPCTSKHQLHNSNTKLSQVKNRKVHLDSSIVDQKEEEDFQTSKNAKLITRKKHSYNDSGISVEKSSLSHTGSLYHKRFFSSNNLPEMFRKQSLMVTLPKQGSYQKTILNNKYGMHQDSSDTSKSQKRKSGKEVKKSTRNTQGVEKTRIAATKAMEKNKMLAKNNVSDFDCYDDIESEGSLYRPPLKKDNKSIICEPVKEKKKRAKKVKKFKADTTGSTVSSDISWLHKKKSGLFETPKKNYTLWKKEKTAKLMKSLPIQVSNKTNVKLQQESKILENEVLKKKKETKQQRRISNKDQKVIEENSKYSDTETRKKLTEWSDLDCYSLTKEKQTPSYHTLNYNKVLQDFDEEVKRSVSGSYNHIEKKVIKLDSNTRPSIKTCLDISALESTQEEEFSEKDFEHNFIDMNMQPELNYNPDSFHNAEEALIENSSEINAICNLKLKKSKNNPKRSDSSTTVTNDLEEWKSNNNILENESSKNKTNITNEENFIPERLFDSGIENTELFKEISPEDYNLLTDEANGKEIHLNRYLMEAALPDKSKNKTYSNDDISLSVESETLNTKSMKRNRTKDEDCDEENLIKKGRISETVPIHYINSNEQSCEENKMKYGLFSKAKTEIKSSFMNEIHKDSEQDESEKLSLYSEMSNIRKICRSDILSKNLVLRKENLANAEPSIFKVLSNEMKKLTKQLVGTIQKYVNDFCQKLTSHRENIVKSTDLLSQQDIAIIDKQDLILYQKECRKRRLCLEKNLRKLQEISNAYFEAEEQCNKKLLFIQKKATKKFTYHVQVAKYNAMRMMETKSLLEIKKFLSKFQLDVG